MKIENWKPVKVTCEKIVFDAMRSGKWLTPAEIQRHGIVKHGEIYSDSSITRRIRELREVIGADRMHIRKRKGCRSWEYQVRGGLK